MTALFVVAVLITIAGCTSAPPAAKPAPTPTPASESTPESTAPEPESSPTPSEDVPRISLEELLQKMESETDFILVDTRTAGEYEIDYIKGAVSVPLAVITAGEWVPPPGKEVILYCA